MKRYQCFLLMAILGCLFLSACSDSSTSGELGSLPDATFSTTSLSNNANKIVVKSTSDDVFMWRWDFGNGASSTAEVDTVTYIEKGNYTITLTAFNQGGADSTSKQINIESDYQGENILQDDGALTSDNWTYLNIPGGGKLDVTFSNNTANFSNASFSYGAIYQPVQVEAGVEYIFSVVVESNSGMGSQSWFEIYFGTSEPVQGQDYLDNKFVSLNTYVPCGDNPFDGDLAVIGCGGSGTGNGGIVTFSNTGTVYLVIKAGSNGGTLGPGGITLKSINLAKL